MDINNNNKKRNVIHELISHISYLFGHEFLTNSNGRSFHPMSKEDFRLNRWRS
jgi:hypothetical protein